MQKEIKDLIEISQYYGRDMEYVIAGGGNTSFKNDEFIWIKASGIALADIGEDGFVKLSREKLKVISERNYSMDSTEREAQVKEDLAAAVTSENGKRPSVETSMHEVINYPFVVHTHPTLVNALSCSKDAEKLTQKILGDKVLFIEYIDPGYVLFKRVADDIKKYHQINGYDPKIILLENHGIFVSADTTDEIREIYADIENKLLKQIGTNLPDDEALGYIVDNSESLVKAFKDEENIIIKAYTNSIINDFIKDQSNFSRIETAFTPDHIVYNKAHYLFLEEYNEDNIEGEIHNFRNAYGYLPKIIGVKNKGIIIAGDSEKAVTTSYELILNMMKISWLAKFLGGSKPMTDHQIAFIENWEVENYRKKMAKQK